MSVAARSIVRPPNAHIRTVVLTGAIFLVMAVFPALAAAESCTYNAGTKAVSATIDPGGDATLVVVGGALHFGATPSACGAATTTNTDSISITGGAGTLESLTLDESGGGFGPGAATETNFPEIEMTVALGDAGDELLVIGTSANDNMAMGASGFSFNNDGDVDVTFSPFPGHVEVRGGGGVNFLTGRGGWGAGLAYAGNVTLIAGDLGDELNGGNGHDELVGGAGNDVMNGNAGDDRLEGNGANDKLSGGEGKDFMVGGPGADTFTGGFGNDLLVAHDGQADTSINGGGDTDIAYYDPGLDPTPSATETAIPAAPSESCSYDAGTHAVTARIALGSEATLKVAANGELLFGFVPTACGAATTTNTDSIQVLGAPGAAESFTLDMSEGFLGPGFTSEFNLPEIEMAMSLGDSTDEMTVIGTAGNDTFAPGQNGMALNTDGDVDVTWTPNPGVFPIEIQGRDGDDFINGRGQGGAGLAYLGPLLITGGLGNDELVGSHSSDEIYGGEGNDIIFSHQLNDLVDGGPGDDAITSGEGNDHLIGGPGADNLNAGFGNDFLDADDNQTDTQIHGGPDTDTAYYDGAGIDPAPIAVENAIADPGQEPPPPPPPPPAGACEYRAATQAVVASMPTSGTATLAVVGGEIRFGETPVACGVATTTNTDSVEILGVSGAAEHLTLDQSAGLLAPGATGESNTPEIELSLKLGDAADELIVVGTAANDTFAAGLSGVSLNSDGDVDITFDVLPGEIDFSGGGGVNFLTGRGGFGAGLAYAGVLTLIGGDLGDELNGGNGNDVIVGGAGNDVINGNAGNDQISGGGGNDSIAGGDGNDTIVGGAGIDTLNGGFDNDVLEADDDEADAQIHGGPGTDTAYIDAGVDPATIAVETVIPR